ncbi:MAG: Hpt domain-containing protein [Chitinophagaceae bacterium]
MLDLSYLQSLSRGNSAFEKHMLNIFMEDIPPQMEELRTAVALANAQQASDVSHKMKSSFRMLGIGKGAELLQQIEDETKNGNISSMTPEQVREVSDILNRSLAEIDQLLGVTR